MVALRLELAKAIEAVIAKTRLEILSDEWVLERVDALLEDMNETVDMIDGEEVKECKYKLIY